MLLRILGFRAMGQAARRLPPECAHRIIVGTALAANLFPIVGVLAGWMTAEDVFAAYWADLVIVGVFAIVRSLTATGGSGEKMVDRITMVVFFLALYGLLVVLQAMFLVMLFGSESTIVAEFMDRIGLLTSDNEITAGTAWIPVAIALLVSELVGLVLDWFVRGDRHEVGSGFALMQPFGQMVPMVFIMTVLGGIGAVLVRYLHLGIVPVTLLAVTRLSIYFGRMGWMMSASRRPSRRRSPRGPTSAADPR